MPTNKSPLQVFQSRKMLALLLLGFASGMPLFLTSRTLQAWLTVEGIDLASIGLLSLVALPYSIKFLWAPILDRYIPPFFGRRRGWLAIAQIGLTIAIAFMAWQQPKQSLQLLAINALIIAFLSASQDVAFDAYRTDILEPWETGAGAAVGVLGYRIALLVTGGLALILADRISWQGVYLCMAGLMGINIIFSIWSPEPILKEQPPSNLAAAIVLPFQDFFQRFGIVKSILILIFIILYRLGDALVNNMVTPFLLQIGFTQTDIGAIQGGMGLIATIVGTLFGGLILSRIGINRSLWVFGFLQAFSNFVYLILAELGQNYQFMVIAINIENICSGLATAGFVAFMMNLCNQRFSATQYALLSSLMAFSRDILVAPTGFLVKEIGWSGFFLFTLIAGLPGLILLPWFAPWNLKSVSIDDSIS
jgi:MFS transporter, PAT family, beta-lactamase induction signal transducer AmpG